MKIWKEFNSSHSSNISIVGTFKNIDDADQAFKVVEDFALASWEERYPSVEDFKEYWSTNYHPNIKYIQITEEDFESGIDNSPDIELDGKKVRISSFRSGNIGGIVKLMRFVGAAKIEIE